MNIFFEKLKIVLTDKIILKKGEKSLEEGLEPSTLWLTATRSSQLSYSSLLMCLSYYYN